MSITRKPPKLSAAGRRTLQARWLAAGSTSKITAIAATSGPDREMLDCGEGALFEAARRRSGVRRDLVSHLGIREAPTARQDSGTRGPRRGS